MDTPTPGRGSESSLAQRILTRYSRFSAQRPHTQMMRRIYRLHGDRLPLASAIQRRWLPTSAPPYQARVTLPYLQPTPFASAGLQTPGTIQRASDNVPIVRTVTSGDIAQPATNAQTSAVQRASDSPTSSSGSLSSTNAQTSAVQRASNSPTSSGGSPPSGNVQASGNAPAVVQRATSGGVLRPAMAVRFVPLVQRTTVMRDSPSVTSRTPEMPPVVPASPLPIQRQPATTAPVQPVAAMPPALPAAPASPATPVRVIPGQSAGVMPTLQRQVQPQPQRTPPAAEPVYPLVRVANPLGTAAIARQVSAPDSPVAGAGTSGASPLPVVNNRRAAPSGSPASSTAPTLSTVILQRHLTTSQRYAGPQPVSTTRPAINSMGMAVTAVQRRPADVSTNRQFAGALPLAQMITSMAGTAYGQPVARQTLAGQQSVSSSPAAAQQPVLPLVIPAANGAVQRQADMQSSSAATANNGSSPVSAPTSQSTSADAAGSGETSQSNADEVVDKVWRKLMRWLAVEGERRGGRLWP